MLRCLSSIAVALACSSLGAAQEPSIRVQSPSQVFELESGFAFSVTGSGVLDGTPAIRVFEGASEITSQLDIMLDEESRVDSDSDGVLESYDGEFTITFDPYLPSSDRVLRVEATADAPAGPVSAYSATVALSHLHLAVSRHVMYGDTAVHVLVRTTALFVDSMNLQVFLGNDEVTTQVTITGPVTTYDHVDEGTPLFVRHRVQYYLVDVSSLGEFEQPLSFVAIASGSGSGGTSGTTTGTDQAKGKKKEAEGAQQCKDALDKFMNDLGLSGGSPSGGPVSVGASAEAIQAAAGDLKDALKANNCPMSGSHTAGGRTMIYDVGEDGGGGDTKKGDASGGADLVVAIGGDADPTSSAAGGSATAENSKAGGAAIAVGGTSGGTATGDGSGGAATASATLLSPGSQPALTQAAALGGKGGTPSNLAKTGGAGGTATSKVGVGWGGTGPGEPGQTGAGGAGAWSFTIGSSGWIGIPPN